MMLLRRIFISGLFLAITQAAFAAEQISQFDVAIEVETNGDIIVTETINVTSEGNQIRRGIFRDLPRLYTQDGIELPYRYDVLSIRREGKREPYQKSKVGNAIRLRIGDADVFLGNGAHSYEIRYRAKNQVRYFDGHDEIYWNATGNYWAFPIVKAQATVRLPQGAKVTSTKAYTGKFGDTDADYDYLRNGDNHTFKTKKALAQNEGLTIAIGFEKGLIDPPSSADKSWLWWQRNGSIAVLVISLLGLFGFYYRSFDRVGRDPAKGPVFPRYAPPEGYSPAAVHQIFHRGMNGHKALIATIMNLAVKGRLTIDAASKKATTLTRSADMSAMAGFSPIDLALENKLFKHGSEKSLGKKYDADFTSAYESFKSAISREYGASYFKWNFAYVFVGGALTFAAVFYAIKHAPNWSILHTNIVILLAGLNGWFAYLMPAPTSKGQEIRTEIEGFKLYLDTAEKLQLNATKVGSDAPPMMTTERYERFLPYAVALGVEKPWTRHFEKRVPEEAKAYSPAWTNMSSGGFRSLSGLSSALVSNMSSGVTSALPQSSSSSGSSGGGSSGGGGGGGGGGGW